MGNIWIMFDEILRIQFFRSPWLQKITKYTIYNVDQKISLSNHVVTEAEVTQSIKTPCKSYPEQILGQNGGERVGRIQATRGFKNQLEVHGTNANGY